MLRAERGLEKHACPPRLSTRQPLFHVRECISYDCDDSGIFRQFLRHDFVQRVSSGVVIIEIETAVLNRTESGDIDFLQWLDVSANVFGKICSAGAGFLKDG